MANDIFGGASYQDMLQPGVTVRRSDDDIGFFGFGSGTDLLTRMPELQKIVCFDALAV